MSDTDIAAFAPLAWVHGDGVMSLERARVMGILNLTPDSFSDGGALLSEGRVDVAAAVEAGLRLVQQGADVLDLGGESTRPGAVPVTVEDECERVLPVIERLRAEKVGVPLSIDTRHAAVAERAIRSGAAIVNDVSGLADPAMVEVVAASEAGLVIGHLRGEPQRMQREIRFVDMLREVTDELAASVQRAIDAGIERPRIVVDPGIGFGKSAEQSAALVAASGWLRQATGCPVLIGASRKSFLSVLGSHRVSPKDRLVGSLAAAMVAVERGASVLRVHDVAQTVEALAVAAGIRAAFERQAHSKDNVH